MNLITMFPFKNVKKLTDEQREWYEKRDHDIRTLVDVYNDAFYTTIENCVVGSGLHLSIEKQLKKLYDYEEK